MAVTMRIPLVFAALVANICFLFPQRTQFLSAVWRELLPILQAPQFKVPPWWRTGTGMERMQFEAVCQD
jgi:hypothetical protein